MYPRQLPTYRVLQLVSLGPIRDIIAFYPNDESLAEDVASGTRTSSRKNIPAPSQRKFSFGRSTPFLLQQTVKNFIFWKAIDDAPRKWA